MWAKSLDSGPWAPWTAQVGDCTKVLECECGVRPAPYVEAEGLSRESERRNESVLKPLS